MSRRVLSGENPYISFMKSLLLPLFILCVSLAHAQDPYEYAPELEDYPARQQHVTYKWPYTRRVPGYVGLVLGWEGFKSNYYQAGLALNLVEIQDLPGGMIGGQALYQRHISENLQRFQVEAGFYTLVCGGVNFNYSIQGEHSTFGVKPFIGLSLFNVQFLYGYNFINKKKNQISSLRNSSFEFRFVIPLVSFGKDTSQMEAVPSSYPNQSSGYSVYRY